jgi:hypothetical protein
MTDISRSAESTVLGLRNLTHELLTVQTEAQSDGAIQIDPHTRDAVVGALEEESLVSIQDLFGRIANVQEGP